MLQLLDRVKDLLSGQQHVSATENSDPTQLACAALLLQMAAADFEADPAEHEAVKATLRRFLQPVSGAEIDELLELARSEAEGSVSLFDFTSVIHREWNEDQKADLVRELWAVGFADGHLDPKEEFLVRKVSGLLHLPHPRFIAAKQDARDAYLRGQAAGNTPA